MMDWSALGSSLTTIIKTVADSELTFVTESGGWADDATSDTNHTVPCLVEYTYTDKSTTARLCTAIIGVIAGYNPSEKDKVTLNGATWTIDGIVPMGVGKPVGYEVHLKR